ncbi:hypothetical protein HDV05_005096 [Chytridiales sp. JEL 0842]|nr:hypothetical protein HDV05_005096 [Chytridiales sp. JEL 0842]
MSHGISILPAEINLNILHLLSAPDLLQCSMVNATWRDLTNDNRIWKNLCRDLWKDKLHHPLALHALLPINHPDLTEGDVEALVKRKRYLKVDDPHNWTGPSSSAPERVQQGDGGYSAEATDVVQDATASSAVDSGGGTATSATQRQHQQQQLSINGTTTSLLDENDSTIDHINDLSDISESGGSQEDLPLAVTSSRIRGFLQGLMELGGEGLKDPDAQDFPGPGGYTFSNDEEGDMDISSSPRSDASSYVYRSGSTKGSDEDKMYIIEGVEHEQVQGGNTGNDADVDSDWGDEMRHPPGFLDAAEEYPADIRSYFMAEDDQEDVGDDLLETSEESSTTWKSKEVEGEEEDEEKVSSGESAGRVPTNLNNAHMIPHSEGQGEHRQYHNLPHSSTEEMVSKSTTPIIASNSSPSKSSSPAFPPLFSTYLSTLIHQRSLQRTYKYLPCRWKSSYLLSIQDSRRTWISTRELAIFEWTFEPNWDDSRGKVCMHEDGVYHMNVLPEVQRLRFTGPPGQEGSRIRVAAYPTLQVFRDSETWGWVMVNRWLTMRSIGVLGGEEGERRHKKDDGDAAGEVRCWFEAE